MKTYPFTSEDENQLVEIGSFMCESRINIDGRYDRNRGQLSNLNMTPQNFNLINYNIYYMILQVLKPKTKNQKPNKNLRTATK